MVCRPSTSRHAESKRRLAGASLDAARRRVSGEWQKCLAYSVNAASPVIGQISAVSIIMQ